MVAICSDLDGTRTADEYKTIAKLLNTEESIPGFGKGFGLEVGNSIYFYEEPHEFSYWNGTNMDREILCSLIGSGHIDCLHSFGNLATTREHAIRALDELARRDCKLQVWVNHASAPTNFGTHIPGSQGDVPGAPAYHADLTLSFGIRWAWCGRVTSVVAQSVRRRYVHLIQEGKRARGAATAAREAARVGLARLGSKKFSLHSRNTLTQPLVLRDGSRVMEFIRSNPHPLGVTAADTGAELGEILTSEYLDTLERRGGFAILYTHLARRDGPGGFGTGSGALMCAATRKALSRLAERSGSILVTTTRRLLGYADMRNRVRARLLISSFGNELHIDTAGFAQEDLQGLTFALPDPARTRVFVDGVETELRITPHGVPGGPSISLPWNRLEFPDI